ncbi:MAG: response regulator [SAR324 cluster bacterium]|nr:response regulator [SAR324 cluster bacterium]
MDKKPGILIVDDQENNRLVIEDILRKLKCTIKGASSGEEALEILQVWPADLILMDQMMPGLSGIETVKRIKAQKQFEQIPILMVTAKDETATLKEAFEAGAMDYIIKPVERVTLLARVGSALRTKQAFDEIKQLTETLTRQTEELTHFTHMVSHDLKSPAASAASLFEFFLFRLKEDYADVWNNQDFQEILVRIPRLFRKMLGFVDTMLNYASSGKIVGELVLVGMNSVIEEVLPHFDPQREEGIVEFKISPSLPQVECDPLKMGQVWQNLLGNAIKYRGETNPVEITIGCEEHGNGYRFWIHDNGPGIDPEDQESIFQPFTRANDTVEGSGIGLATVTRIIQAHHGKIYVDSQNRTGAKFMIEFPRPGQATS